MGLGSGMEVRVRGVRLGQQSLFTTKAALTKATLTEATLTKATLT